MRNYSLARDIDLFVPGRVAREDALRQMATAAEVLGRFVDLPGIVLADEVGMGKTFVAMAVAASVVLANPEAGPVIVMVPPSLKMKWPRDWSVFREKCVKPDVAARLRVTKNSVESGVEFLKLLDDPMESRKNVIFLTHGALSRGLTDPWVKLALIRRVFRRPTLAGLRRAFPRYAGRLLRVDSHRGLTENVFSELLVQHPKTWKRILNRAGLEHVVDDPVPAHLTETITELSDESIEKLASSLCSLPLRRTTNIRMVLRKASAEIKEAMGDLWRDEWLLKALQKVPLPLLILDEAHHLKNPQTRLATLFIDEGAENDASYLGGPLNQRFERMLFLTATPFQLGHSELMNVLERFTNVSVGSQTAPKLGKDAVKEKLNELKRELDNARVAAVALDRTWGKLKPEDIVGNDGKPVSVSEWWNYVGGSPGFISPFVEQLHERYTRTAESLRRAEALLQPWVIRHLKPRFMENGVDPRRVLLPGAGISQPDAVEAGIDVSAAEILPFLLAARAVSISAKEAGRAHFAEGLSSSYEAYRDTRNNRVTLDDEEEDISVPRQNGPLAWYLDKLDNLIARELDRRTHPKVKAVVDRATDLWGQGEKVLIFCHYRATGKALTTHLSSRIDGHIMDLACERFGWQSPQVARQQLAALGKRLQNKEDRLRQELDEVLAGLVQGLPGLTPEELTDFTNIQRRFLRTPSFLARFFPPSAIQKRGELPMILDQKDSSGLTLRDRVRAFGLFLAERTTDERNEYLIALGKINTGAHRVKGEGILGNIRLANGETESETRHNLLLSFNTPFFPEILVASSVLAEGVDLHLNCRYVIHHDLCWNPSTLEQRTGRVDRVGAKADRVQQSIYVYLPYLAATQDEKMYRVVRDREKWFQVVMGEKYSMDEASTDRIAARVPLPEELARELALRLEPASERENKRIDALRV